MTQSLRQTLKLSQQLVMTPQLQQAIKLLQLTRMELVDAVQQELVENPVLEELDEYEETAADRDELPGMVAGDADLPELSGGQDDSGDAVDNMPGTADKGEIDWDAYIAQSQSDYQGGSSAFMEDREDYENPIVRSTTLQEHLEWQLQMSDIEGEERVMAAHLIGEFNDDGYLMRPLQEIAQDKHWDVEDLEEALLAVQEFDPLGVGARDLRECLLIQIRAMSGDHLLLKKLVEDHLHDIEKRQFKKIAQSLKIPLEQVGELLEQLRHLEPKPGRPFSGRDAQHVVPDIYIVKVGDEYNVVLNDDGMPRLRVSNFYKSMITNGAVGKDKEYIQERLRSAVWMIRSIHQRQRTIYKVTQSIVKHQRPFLEKGVTALRPMVLRDVAEDIEMHESTISRATTNKYVHTPQGIYELKFFFNSGIDSTDGSEALASEAVKQHIASIIDEEDSKKPYSDQAIVKLLAAKHGLKIARRTVTKYREILGYPSSTKRKKVF